MAKKKETELATSVDAPIVVPDWMQQEEVKGIEQVGEHMTTPRLAIIQAMSDQDRKETFGEGGVAIMPDGVKVAGKDEEFIAIPLVFWVTWEQWSDINDSGSPMIENSTQDSTHEIAKKARNKDTREEMYGEGFKRRYVESLNFIMKIDSGDAMGELATISFSVGEHHTGSRLCGLLKRRPCSIFANRIAFRTALRQRNNRSWYGFDFANPETDAIIQDKAVYEELEKVHDSLSGLVNTNKLVVNREDIDTRDELNLNTETIPI